MPKDTVKVYLEELFEVEFWKQYEAYFLECEQDPEYKSKFNQTKEAFFRNIL